MLRKTTCSILVSVAVIGAAAAGAIVCMRKDERGSLSGYGVSTSGKESPAERPKDKIEQRDAILSKTANSYRAGPLCYGDMYVATRSGLILADLSVINKACKQMPSYRR